jgi:hypothetical protein
VFVLFVNLAFTTVFDIFLDGIAHTSPVHCSTERFLESGCARVLEAVVVPTYCSVLESSGQNHGHAFAQDLSIFNQLGGEAFIT